MKLYTKVKVIRISEEQHNTLVKMKSYNVDVGKFIREAVRDKINKEYKYLTAKEEFTDTFLNSLDKAIIKNS
jgi:hypothetical protein